jgi:uncharacterized membrane protein
MSTPEERRANARARLAASKALSPHEAEPMIHEVEPMIHDGTPEGRRAAARARLAASKGLSPREVEPMIHEAEPAACVQPAGGAFTVGQQVMGARPIHERAAETKGQLGLRGPQQPPEDVPPQKRATGAEIASLVDKAERRSGGAAAQEMLRGGGGGAAAEVKPEPPAPLCTFHGSIKLLLSMLVIVFAAMVTVGVLATQVSPPTSCSSVSRLAQGLRVERDYNDGNDGSADDTDPCCVPLSSWNDLISAAHSCGTWTLTESVTILVLVSVHIFWIYVNDRCFRDIRDYTGIASICTACGFAIPVFANLGEMWASSSDLSEVCDGNEDWGKIKRIIWPLMIVHFVVVLTAVFGRCVFELCIKPNIEIEPEKDPCGKACNFSVPGPGCTVQ